MEKQKHPPHGPKKKEVADFEVQKKRAERRTGKTQSSGRNREKKKAWPGRGGKEKTEGKVSHR